MNVYIPYCTEMLDTLTRESEKLFVEICVSRREPSQMGWIKFKVSNQASNLEWVTPQENMIHAYATGLMPSSKTSLTTHSRRKLTLATANNLRSDFIAGMSKDAIKSKYGISISSINKCLKGDTY